MTSNDLVERVLAKDPGAERELYETYVDRVFRLAYRMTGQADAAADCTQDTFIRVFNKLDTFRGEAALGTWIVSVAYSVVLNWLRRLNRMRQRELELEVATDTPYRASPDPDISAHLDAAINDLPVGYRTVFLMHDVEGYSHAEIGQALGIQEGTSKAQLSRAKARLRRALSVFREETTPNE